MGIALSFINTLVALFINEEEVCEGLSDALLGGFVSCSECFPVLASDGPLMVKLEINASCRVLNIQDISVSAETASVNFWEPLFGGAQVFDPITSTISFGVGFPGVVSADISIVSETFAFADPPTSDITDATANLDGAFSSTNCVFADPLITCTVDPLIGNDFNVCYNLDSFTVGCD